MRVVMVLEDTPFLQPQYLRGVLDGADDEVVAVGLVTEPPPAADTSRYILRNLHRLRPTEALALARREIGPKLQSITHAFSKSGSLTSVKEVAKQRGVKCFEIRDNVNRPDYVERIRGMSPDVVISSQPFIFKKELLAVPKACCLNRHASLLPSFAGLWPIFHAMRCGERTVGVSIHTMEPRIDSGTVLAQTAVPVEAGDTMLLLYKRSFDVSIGATLEALAKVRRGEMSDVSADRPRSYFSFPTPAQWREFRERGHRIA